MSITYFISMRFFFNQSNQISKKINPLLIFKTDSNPLAFVAVERTPEFIAMILAGPSFKSASAQFTGR